MQRHSPEEHRLLPPIPIPKHSRLATASTPKAAQPWSSEPCTTTSTVDEDSDERDIGAKPSLNHKHHKAIGRWLQFLIFASLAVLLGSVGFLTWLWWAPSSTQWRQVVLSSFSTQSITLTGVLVRTATSLLAAVATSMIASLAIERRGVPMNIVAETSIARFTNNGPISIFRIIFGSALEMVLRVPAGLLLFTTIASQFTSTVLVADLGPRPVPGFARTIANTYTMMPVKESVLNNDLPPSLAGATVDYWKQKPSGSEVFAEYAEPVERKEGVDDTGPTIRAFLPIATQGDRESIHEFKGMARVIDSRVVCLRPNIGSLSFCGPPFASLGNLSLCGTVSRDQQPEDVWMRSPASDKRDSEYLSSLSYNFECPIPTPDDTGLSQYDWSLCSGPNGGLKSMLASSDGDAGNSFLVWDSGSVYTQLVDEGIDVFDGNPHLAWSQLNSTQSGPWLEVWNHVNGTNTLGDKAWEIEFRMKMTWCFDAFIGTRASHLNITASTEHALTEPQYTWDHNQNMYNTAAVRKQLGTVLNGTSVASEEDRQILTISPRDMKASLADIQGKPKLSLPYVDRFNWLDVKVGLFTQHVALCPTCDTVNPQTRYSISGDILATTFSAIINETASPALSVQALKTTIMRMAYYDLMSSFTADDNATVVRFQMVSIPQSFRGYWAVMVIIILHLLLFLFIFYLFRVTNFSLIDNAWHTMAQVSENPEISEMLRKATLARDDDVKKWIHSTERLGGIADMNRHAAVFTRPATWLPWRRSKSVKVQVARFVVKEGVFIRAAAAAGNT